MAPLAKVAAETAATAATYHVLVARKVSNYTVTVIVCVAFGLSLLMPFIIIHAVRHFKKNGTVKSYIKDVLYFVCVVLLCIIICIPWGIFTLFFGKYMKKRKEAAAAAAAAEANAAAIAAAEPRRTMPLDPVELAPEEPDLGEPDDLTNYFRPASPPPSQPQPAAAAAADNDSPPAFEEAMVQKPEAAVLRPEPPPPVPARLR